MDFRRSCGNSYFFSVVRKINEATSKWIKEFLWHHQHSFVGRSNRDFCMKIDIEKADSLKAVADVAMHVTTLPEEYSTICLLSR